MSLINQLSSVTGLLVKQQKELAELLGFETRNKYSIETEDGKQIGFAAEQQKGIAGFLLRQFLGHWRSFDIQFFDSSRQPAFKAVHPFRFYFQRLDVLNGNPQPIGTIERRFSILSKKFDILGPQGETQMSVESPIWKIWTFPVIANNQEVAVISKKWSGALKEIFTDADNFHIQFKNPQLSNEQKLLILTAGVFVDLQYFERKAGD